jgi:Insulin/IGF/Relaxin family
MLSTVKLLIVGVYLSQFTQICSTEQLSNNQEFQHFERVDRTDANAELFKRITTRKYCGRVLSEALAFVCRNVYKRFSHESGNKSNRTSFVRKFHKFSSLADEVQQQPVIETVQPPFLPRHVALNLKAHHRKRRHTGGIVQECCHKSCALNELKSYCGSL